ncbi:carboxyesterase 17 [Actinidia rufa]|uniref:Carboxyesterase 17 n=1 Tax=Actinidia rufa TaxID=165716 RepID=A0A7J0GZ52_9ERIC|nr:carboxyesterase 17 [Actinidia rufa]
MTATTLDPSLSQQINTKTHRHGAVVEEIEGLIRVYKDGHVERPQIVPCVMSSLASELVVTSRDIVIDKPTNIWARFYLPKYHGNLPLLVYFHGGGFCVGSAAWSCYHEFLAKLAARAGCLILSVNYRLAPENRLPAAYEDGFKALMWVKQQAICGGGNEWWSKKCNFSSIFLAGDSAGANIAHNVAIRLNSCQSMSIKPLTIKGTILIQPFFGGERRTNSEKYTVEPPRSALSLTASDTYWRLALPPGASRDHPWCNPGAKGSIQLGELGISPIMVCVAEMDILRERTLDMCAALARAGKQVECVVHKSVGHAFQVLNKSQLSQTRTLEMISHIKAFIIR